MILTWDIEPMTEPLTDVRSPPSPPPAWSVDCLLQLKSSNGISPGGWKPDLYFSITNLESYNKIFCYLIFLSLSKYTKINLVWNGLIKVYLGVNISLPLSHRWSLQIFPCNLSIVIWLVPLLSQPPLIWRWSF